MRNLKVTGLPARAAAAGEAIASSLTRHIVAGGHLTAAERIIQVPEGAALEAAGAAGKVVGPAVSDSAVPVAGPDVRANAGGGPPQPETAIISGPCLSTPLARLSPLEVQVLTRPAIPVSWPVIRFPVPAGFLTFPVIGFPSPAGFPVRLSTGVDLLLIGGQVAIEGDMNKLLI
nr:hypothetical protein Iba_chr14fCG8960 [Ipomoea batatas]